MFEPNTQRGQTVRLTSSSELRDRLARAISVCCSEAVRNPPGLVWPVDFELTIYSGMNQLLGTQFGWELSAYEAFGNANGKWSLDLTCQSPSNLNLPLLTESFAVTVKRSALRMYGECVSLVGFCSINILHSQFGH